MRFLLLFIFFTTVYADCSCSCHDERLDDFGRIGWEFIHTVASNYPEKPTFIDKQYMLGFMYSIANLYPCEICRNHLQHNLDNFGFHFNNRTDLSTWLCFLHNKVNEKNLKPTFPCDMDKLDNKYRIF